MTELLLMTAPAVAEWIDGEFGRAVGASLVGVFVPAAIGWAVARWRDRRLAEDMLFAGLLRNLICVQRIREIVERSGVSPETRLVLDHLQLPMLRSVYGSHGNAVLEPLLNAQFALASLANFVQTFMEVERDNWLARQLTGGAAQERSLEGYVEALLDPDPNRGRIVQAEEAIQNALQALNRRRFRRELERHLTS